MSLMLYNNFNIGKTVRDAVGILDGEFTFREVLTLIRCDHTEFNEGFTVSSRLTKMVKKGKLIRVQSGYGSHTNSPTIYRKSATQI